MKVLQINVVNGTKSTGRACLELAEYLNENGHQSYVACALGQNYDFEYLIGSYFGKKVHALFSRLFGNQGYYSRFSTYKLIKYIDTLNPDIIHLNTLHSNYINLKMLFNYINIKNMPTVITLHDAWFYTGKCCFYTEANCFRWLNECGKCPQLKKDNPSWFFDRTMKNLLDKKKWIENTQRLAVVGVSDWITNEARRSILNTAKIISRVYNWIDLDEFKPIKNTSLKKALNLQGEFIIIGVASKWVDRKGLLSFIELSKMITNGMKIILVGRIDEDVSLPNNIINIPETNSKQELAEYYSMADVFITFSKEESFGKVTAEALACGTPAIVYDSTANSEIVGEDCGYVVQTDNIVEVMSCITKIELHGKETFSDNCRQFVINNFSKEDRIRDYLDIYTNLVKF